MSMVSMDMNLENENIEKLLRVYISDKLPEESLVLFNDLVAQGANVFNAAGRAMLNECVIDVLDDIVGDAKQKDLEQIQTDCEHNWEDNGHGHNYHCYKCRKCGKEKEV